MTIAIQHPYLMFLGDAPDQLAAKTAQGIVHWRPDWCAGQLRLEDCKADLRIPDMTIPAAAEAGVKTVIVGVANRGGILPDLIEPLRASPFMERFCAKGRYRDYLAAIPVYLVTAPDTAFRGLASLIPERAHPRR